MVTRYVALSEPDGALLILPSMLCFKLLLDLLLIISLVIFGDIIIQVNHVHIPTIVKQLARLEYGVDLLAHWDVLQCWVVVSY